MKLYISSSLLQKKLPLLNHAISSKNQLPVLSNIAIETKNGKIILSATDLEIGIQTEIHAEIIEEGEVTVPAKIFTELVSTLPDENIEIITEGNNLNVKSKKTISTFQTIEKNEFPSLYKEKGEEILIIKQDDIQKSLSKVFFAASSDTTRPALSGIYIKNQDGKTIFVATDGYRLSLKQMDTGEKTPVDSPILIPSRVIKELILLKQEGDVSVFISKENNQALFFQGDTVLIGRLIESEFPSYEKIIPTSHESSAVFDRQDLLAAVKTGAIFARETANIVKLSVQKEKITVSANAPSVGKNSVEIETRLIGEENEIAFNARYLLDFLSAIEEEEMVFEMTGPLNPGVFKIKDDDSFLHIIMPIRVQAEN